MLKKIAAAGAASLGLVMIGAPTADAGTITRYDASCGWATSVDIDSATGTLLGTSNRLPNGAGCVADRQVGVQLTWIYADQPRIFAAWSYGRYTTTQAVPGPISSPISWHRLQTYAAPNTTLITVQQF